MSQIEDIRQKGEILRTWIADFNQRANQLPAVQQSLELTDYQLSVVSSFPSGISQAVQDSVVDAYANTAQFWRIFTTGSAPSPRYVAQSGVALETSGSNIAHQAISCLAVSHFEPVAVWAREQTARYRIIQERQGRDEDIKLILARLRPRQLREFEISSTTFAAALADPQSQSAFGIAARNILEHLKGELFAASQRALQKQKVKWRDFADVLSRGGVGSPEHIGLYKEESTHAALHSKLTDLAKSRHRLNEIQLHDLRTELHDHIFTVLFLVDETTLMKHSRI